MARRPASVAALIIGLFAVEAATASSAGLSIGVSLYPADIVFVIVFAATMIRIFVRVPATRRPPAILLLLSTLFFISLVRGVALYGLKTSGVEMRPYFYFLVGALFFSTCKFTKRLQQSIPNIWLVASMFLVALAVLRWIAMLVGLPIELDVGEGEASTLRVLVASQTMFLAEGALLSLYLNINGQGRLWHRKALNILFPIVFLLRHRTVWLVILISFLWMALSDRRFRKWLPVGIAGLAIVAAVFAIASVGVRLDLGAMLQQSATDDTTFIWRLAGWGQLLQNWVTSGSLNIAIGQPFGAGYKRQLLGGIVTAAPHSFYVQSIIRLGLVGFCLLVAMYRKAIRISRLSATPPDSRFWTVVVICQVVYNFTYSPSYIESILLGLTLAMVPAHRAMRNRVRPVRIAVPSVVVPLPSQSNSAN